MSESFAIGQDSNDWKDEEIVHWLDQLMDKNPERFQEWMGKLGLF